MSIRTALRAALAAAALAAAAASPAAASVQVGASGWQWGNPLPQGNTLRTMAFSGSTGYAAGDFGTLLKTTDGGTTWSGLPVGTFAGLSVVQALSSDTVFAGGGCVARRSTDGGRSFTAVRFASVEAGCRVPLRDLSFVSADVGYVLLDDGSLLATGDGGTRFSPRTAVPGTRRAGGVAAARAIAFLDAQTGFAASGGRIFRTGNGGRSWSDVEGDFGPTINRLSFTDAQQGFAVTQGGKLLRTSDGGARWMVRASAGDHDLTSISCNSSRFCVMTTAAGTELVRVERAGEGAPSTIKPATDSIYAAAFASPTRVVGAGASGATVLSDDVGSTFTALGGRLGGSYTALRAGGELNAAFAAGADGALGRTTDGGRTWSTSDVPTSADLLDVAFPTNAIGYALDRDGGLFRTDDGGASWKPLGTGSTRRPRALLAPDENAAMVVGPVGMRRSTDAGETFSQVRARAVVRVRLDGAAAVRGGALIAWGPRTLLRSVNRGASWSVLPRPGRTARERRALRIAQASFASAQVGLLRDDAGRVWRTADGGRRWALLTSVGTDGVVGMAAGSARAAYLVVSGFGGRDGGYLLRSGDAGATWAPQLVVEAPIRGAGIATSGGVDYLLAGDASLLFSTSGGVLGDPSELRIATKRRQLARGGRITVTGRLSPAAAGAQVTVSALAPGSSSWGHQTVAVAANGTFATAWRVNRGTTTFVAQWAGDVASAGAGSRPLTVTGAPRAARRGRGR